MHRSPQAAGAKLCVRNTKEAYGSRHERIRAGRCHRPRETEKEECIMMILGITDGQTSGAAIIYDGRIVAAINDERLLRMKQARGFPRASIKAVMEMTGVNPSDIDGVAVAQRNMEFRNDPAPWKGWFEERQDLRESHNLFFNLASRFSGLANDVPGLKTLYYQLRQPLYRERRRRIPQILREEFSITAPVQFYNHHYAHATSAYFTCGFEDGLIVTMDGGGDGSSSHIYVAKGGTLKNVCAVDSYDSLGNYYAYVTAICGYKAKKHEGKITGLAAHGRPRYYDALNRLIAFEHGKTVNKGKVLFNSAMQKIRQEIGEPFSKEDLAASIQKLSEDICRAYVGHWLEQTRSRNVALAGGVFANVRINQEVHNLPGVETLFVHPGMSDEGLAVGAGLAMWAERVRTQGGVPRSEMIPHVYLGSEFTEREIEAEIQRAGHAYQRYEEIEKEIARLLAEGYVVARFNGRMEYGPRALGNRSILYQPTDPSVNDWLNKNLVRTEFMPFAPSTLAEYAGQCYEDVGGGFDSARFMTITFQCTDWMKRHCGGVVHLDGTARPQLVREEDNPSYYKIIKEFHALTGLPSVINTSFNMHEEPIVCTPNDAIRAFELGHLDYLAIGPFLLKNPKPLTHRPKPVRRVEE
ncbi:MAG: hypothetical protein D6690_01685 [Nitrospirae bacterium]|nr:MAG: hypothetical protein D6690_01685 [Nitrospirota bacterium]